MFLHTFLEFVWNVGWIFITAVEFPLLPLVPLINNIFKLSEVVQVVKSLVEALFEHPSMLLLGLLVPLHSREGLSFNFFELLQVLDILRLFTHTTECVHLFRSFVKLFAEVLVIVGLTEASLLVPLLSLKPLRLFVLLIRVKHWVHLIGFK